MKNSKKNHTMPLQTINQNPGKEDCSFVYGEDHSQTNTMSLSPGISSETFGKMSNLLQNQKGKRQKKNNDQNENQKIIINQKNLKDIQLVKQQFGDALVETSRSMKQSKYSSDMINVIMGNLEKMFETSVQEILSNSIEVKEYKSLKEIVPIEINLSENVYKINEISMDLLKKGRERLGELKDHSIQIKFNGEIPKQAMIRNAQNQLINEKDYLETGLKKVLKEEIESLRSYEKVQNNFVKKYEEFKELYKLNNAGLSKQFKGKTPKTTIKIKPVISSN